MAQLLSRGWLLGGLLIAASAGGYLFATRRAAHLQQDREAEMRHQATVDAIRIAQLVHDSTARALREQTRIRDSAEAAQKTKRQQFTIKNDTQFVVIGDTTTFTLPAPAARALFSYVRGEDAKVPIDSAWLAKMKADTAAIAHERDLWKKRALDDEAQMARERHRAGFKTGIIVGVTATIAIAKAVAEILR
jgi:hypothetical protein